MKARVTISISPEILRYVDRSVGKRGRSRSRVIESIIREASRHGLEDALTALAKDFFSQPIPPEEAEERNDWLKMSLETFKRER